MPSVDTLVRKFARLTTDVVVRSPRLWPLFKPVVERQFDSLAGRWDAIRGPSRLGSFEHALEHVASPPRRALDLGTGTGRGAFAIAARWPEADVVGVDVSRQMIDEARRKTPAELAGRVRFVVADASRLPFADGEFELVGLANTIPFFDELARVLAPGSVAVFAFSLGAETPMYVAPERLRRELGRRGFGSFEELRQGTGTAFLARKAPAAA
jgi:SAM-dependent methyltransferase